MTTDVFAALARVWQPEGGLNTPHPAASGSLQRSAQIKGHGIGKRICRGEAILLAVGAFLLTVDPLTAAIVL